MAYREYIGSRYVPIFGRKNEDTIQWDNGSSYEPLTIVLHEGNSFTSRQYVPAGVDIHDEKFWAQTGNYNAQVEQYRTEVRAFDGRIGSVEKGLDDVQENLSTGLSNVRKDMNDGFREINKTVDDLETRINDDMQIHMLYGNASCTLVQTAGKNIVIDTAVPEDAQRISNMFTQYNVTHVDYVIFSHFHADHCTGYAEVFKYCDSSTRVFRGIDLTDANNDNKQYYDEYLAAITSACNALGIMLEKASNGQVISLSDVDDAYIQFWNANQSYEDYYVNSWKEQDYTSVDKTASYNNYSLITRVVNGMSSYVDCGDIETMAQVLNAPDMQKTSIVKYPHHNTNKMGFSKFFDKLACDTYIYSIYNNQLIAQTMDQATFQTEYFYRYATQCRYSDVYCNFKQPVNVALDRGNYTINGYYINPTEGSIDFDIVPTVRGTLPPAVLYYGNIDSSIPNRDNPNILHEVGLNVIAEWTRYINSINFAYYTSGSEFVNSSEMMKDIRTIFNASDSDYVNGNVFFSNSKITVEKADSYARYPACDVYKTFDRTNFPNTGCRMIQKSVSRTENIYTGNWGQSETPLTDLGVPAHLFNNDIILAKTDDHYVPLVRCTGSSFVGSALSPNGKTAYSIVISSRHVSHTLKWPISNPDNQTESPITELRNVYNA